MTSTEFRQALRRLGLAPKDTPQSGVRAAARWYGVAPTTVRIWLATEPSPLAARLTRLALALLDRGMSRVEIDAMLRG